MASRENQGAHIAAICFAIGFVLTLVLTYIGFKQYGEERKKNENLAQQNQKLQSEIREVVTEGDRYKEMIGMTPEDKLDAMETRYAEDMKLYGENLPEEKPSYRQLVEYLHNAKQTVEQREADEKERARKADEQWQANKADLEKQLAAYDGKFKKAHADTEENQKKFQSERARITKEKEELAAKLEASDETLRTEVTTRDGNIKKLTEQLRQMEAVNTKLANEKEGLVQGSFDVPDGKVARVSQGSKGVWINLGKADGLRPRLTFSVYDVEENNALATPIKAKIEVTRLLGRHLAEARILSDTVSDPIVAGDHIYSPVWQRGRRVSFALVGSIDLDGDSKSDLQKVRDLIELNGGKVDAQTDDNGEIDGEITVNTRFLVVGEQPKVAEDQDKDAVDVKRAIDTYSSMMKTAQNLGVEKISVYEFLDRMGWQSMDRTVPLGPRARSEDFFPRRRPGVEMTTPRSDRETFRKRHPAGGVH